MSDGPLPAPPGSDSKGLRPRWILLLVAAFVLSAAGVLAASYRVRREPPLPRLGGVPAFILFDQNGDPFTSSSLLDKVWLADFFFTRCQGICPVLTGRFRWFQEELGPRPGWHLVSITVDPAHDPPGALTEYARDNGANTDRWTFLTGDPELVRNVVVQGFRLAVEADSTSTVEPFLHSKRIVLVDRDGEIRGYYDADDDGSMKTLLGDVRRLMKEIR